ncbi:MAG: glucosamine-6-phosphate deaminase [Bacteroidetes bacterium]|nr:glucosamine-6-phosphate deaminase [Bacteroidota bacterium]
MSSSDAISTLRIDKLNVEVYRNRKEMGARAASVVVERLKKLLSDQENVRMIFAAAPSQNELLEELASAKGIDWSRVTAFHMDEYVGLKKGAEQSFGTFLNRKIFSKVNFGRVHYINPNPNSPSEECERYSALLGEAAIDIVCLGIGENGHIAFNDPDAADFNDPQRVKVVNLDNRSRQQQVNDGCFSSVTEVPKQAITLTIPSLFSARFMCTVVPAATKAEAVRRTIKGEISTRCPASILRRHENAALFLDADSAAEIL